MDPMTEGPEAENMLIIKENEQLRRGLPQVAAPWDNHATHIQQHFVIMMDPALRQKTNDPVMATTIQHIMSHAQFLFPGIQAPTDPRLMALMGNNIQGPPAPPQPEQPTPGAVSNPMPASGPNGAPPPAAPRPPHAPVLPRSTSPIVANAASQMGDAALPKK